MYMNKKIIFFALFLSLSTVLFSQQNQDMKKPKYSNYYYQRVSLFELLPITSNDIVFLGNSITDGAEWAEIFNMPNVKNRGISGDITTGVYERLDVILKGQPKKIFLLIGINDINRKNSVADSVFKNITKIAEKIRQQSPKTTLYIQSIFPEDFNDERFKNNKEKIISINKNLEDYCLQNKLTYIDLYSKLITPDGSTINSEYSNDGLHLMGSGYMVWKATIEPFVKSKK